MPIISVISMKGGVGKSTLVTNLACAMTKLTQLAQLTQSDRSQDSDRVCVIDLDPQSALQWHFGFTDHNSRGVCKQAVIDARWTEIALKNEASVTCYPYGFADETDRVTFESILTHKPEWLKDQLKRHGIDNRSIALIDTPPGPSPYLPHAIACADLVVVVLFPDAGSYATVPAMESYLDDLIPMNPNLRSVYVLNQFDASEPLGVDIFQQLQTYLGDRFAPLHVNVDEAIRESLAVQQPVLTYDPHGQASHDLAKLAKWLLVELERETLKRVGLRK